MTCLCLIAVDMLLQEAMTFCGDREDVVSMAATAVMRLLQAAGVSYNDIGK